MSMRSTKASPSVFIQRGSIATTGWAGVVTDFASLPPVALHTGEVYLVQNSTGFLWNRKRGLYESDGVTWDRLSNATFQVLDTEAKIIDDVSGNALTQQLSLLTADREVTYQDKDGTLSDLSDITSQNFEDLTNRSTTVEDPSAFDTYLPAPFVTAVLPIGDYKVNPEWGWTLASSARLAQFNVLVDGAVINPDTIELEPSDSANVFVTNIWRTLTFATAVTHTIQLEFRVGAGGGATPTLTVNGFFVDIMRRV